MRYLAVLSLLFFACASLFSVSFTESPVAVSVQGNGTQISISAAAAVASGTTASVQISYVVVGRNEEAPRASQIETGGASYSAVSGVVTIRAFGASASLTAVGLAATPAGLSQGVDYDVYFVAKRVTSPVSFSNVIRVPVTTWRPPTTLKSDITETSFSLDASFHPKGDLFYLVLADGDPVPTDSQIRNVSVANIKSGRFPIVGSALSVHQPITGLTANTTYDVYTVDELISGSLVSSASFDVTTLAANTIPQFSVTHPNAAPDPANGTQFTLTGRTDGASDIVYYVLAASGSAAPSAHEIKDGTIGGGGSAVASGQGTNELNLLISGLTVSTHYTVYVVAEDSTPSFSSVVSLSLFTGNGLPFFTTEITAAPIAAESFSISGTLSESGTIHYVLSTSILTFADAAAVKTAATAVVSAHVTGSVSVDASSFAIPVTGLTASTDYFLYAVGEDADGGLTLFQSGLELSTLSAGQVVAPIMAVSDKTQTSFSLDVSYHTVGSLFYLVLADGSTPPTSAEVRGNSVASIKNGQFPIVSAGATIRQTITGLVAGTTYDIYAVGVDGSENLSVVGVLDNVTTLALAAAVPQFSTPPNATPDTADGRQFTLTGQANDANDIIYYVLAFSGSAAPNAHEIKAGTLGGGGSAVASGQGQGALSVLVSGLTASTDYNIYLVIEDNSPSFSGVVSLSLSTSNGLPFFATAVAVVSIDSTSFSISGTLSEPGTIYYILSTSSSALANTAVQAGATASVSVDASLFSIPITGLTAATDYYISVVGEDSDGGLTSLVSNRALKTLVAGQVVAPNIAASNITRTSFSLDVSYHTVGTLFYLVLADGSTPPSSDQVRNVSIPNVKNGQFPIVSANTTIRQTITGLAAGTVYDIYAVGVDGSGVSGVVGVLADLTTLSSTSVPPETIPQFSTLPDVTPDTADGTRLTLTGVVDDLSDIIYYVVLNGGSTTPSAYEIKAGTANGGGTVVASGRATGTLDTVISGLNEVGEYDVHIVAEDTKPSFSNIVSLQAITSNGLPSFTTTPNVIAADVNEVSLTISGALDEIGTIHYVILESARSFADAAAVKADAAAVSTSVAAGSFSIVVTGLQGSTDYFLYIVGEDSDNQFVSVIYSTPIRTQNDATQPIFAPVPSQTGGTATLDGFTVAGGLNEAGSVKYLIVADGADAPSVADVLTTGTPVVANSSSPFDFTFAITGLVAATSYDMYLIATDALNNNQLTVTKINVNTLDEAPVLVVSNVTSRSVTSLRTESTLNEDGTLYYLVRDASATGAVTAGQIRNAPSTSVFPDLQSGNFSVTAGALKAQGILNLTAGTSYDIYIIGEDSGANLSNIESRTISTLSLGADTISPNFVTLSVTAASDTSGSITASLDEIGSYSYILVSSAGTAPTVAQVLAQQDYGQGDFHSAGKTPVSGVSEAYTSAFATLAGLTDDTEYTVYIVGEDAAIGTTNKTLVETRTFLTPDTLSPVFTQAPVISATWTVATVNMTVDEAHRLYWVALTDGAVAPSSAQVISGTDASDTATTDGSDLSGVGAHTVSVDSLSPGTNYDIYIVAEDTSSLGKNFTAPILLEVKTKDSFSALTGVMPVMLPAIDTTTELTLAAGLVMNSAPVITTVLEQPAWLATGVTNNKPEFVFTAGLYSNSNAVSHYRVQVQFVCQETVGGSPFTFTRNFNFTGRLATVPLQAPEGVN